MKFIATCTLSLIGMVAFVPFATAQDSYQKHVRSSLRAEKRAFELGVCVGQNLAAAGIDVSALSAGSVDATTKAAFKAAIEACRPAKSDPSANSSTSTTTGASASSGSTSSSTSATVPASSTASDGTSATN